MPLGSRIPSRRKTQKDFIIAVNAQSEPASPRRRASVGRTSEEDEKAQVVHSPPSPSAPMIDVDKVMEPLFYGSEGAPPPWIPPWSRAKEGDAAASSSRHFELPMTHMLSRTSMSSRKSRRPSDTYGRVSRQGSIRAGELEKELMGSVLNRLMPLEPLTAKSSSAQSPRGASHLTPNGTVVRAGMRLLNMARRTNVEEPAAAFSGGVVPSQERARGSAATASTEAAEMAAQTGELAASEADLVSFRSFLAQNFGNLYRAFKAMKHAASKAINSDASNQSLNRIEWDWVVSTHLRYGDRALARRLFQMLDRDGRGEVGLRDLSKTLNKGTDIPSLVDFRKKLLEHHKTLQHAFKEMEEMLAHLLDMGRVESTRSGSMRMTHAGSMREAHRDAHPGIDTYPMDKHAFTQASSILGIDPAAAAHYFQVMDRNGDGVLTMEEFLSALTNVAPSVLLLDLRERLLSKYPTLTAALRETTSAAVGASKDSAQLWVAKGLNTQEWCAALAKLGISHLEAFEMFRICDQDGSGDVSLSELRDALRSVAPAMNIEGFWQRFVAEWPEISEREGRPLADKKQLLTSLLQDLRPKVSNKGQLHLLQRTSKSAPESPPRMDSNLSNDRARSRNAAGWKPPAPPISVDNFDLICRVLDISQKDSMAIFAKIVETAQLTKQVASRDLPKERLGKEVMEVSVDGFMDQLQQWTAMSFKVGLSEIVGPTRAVIASLKDELQDPLHPDSPRRRSREERPPTRDAGEDLAKNGRKGSMSVLRFRWQG